MKRPGDSAQEPTLQQIAATPGAHVGLLSHVGTDTLTRVLQQGVPRQEPRHRHMKPVAEAVQFEQSCQLTEDGELLHPCDIPGAELPRGST